MNLVLPQLIIGPAIGKSTNLSTTSYFVACSLSAATNLSHLSVQNGQIIYPSFLLNDTDKPWTILSPEATTNSSTELVNVVSGFVLSMLYLD